MDPRAAKFLLDHSQVMTALDGLAHRYGQSISVAYVPEIAEEFGIPPETLLVRYNDGEPLAAIHEDGNVLMLAEGTS